MRASFMADVPRVSGVEILLLERWDTAGFLTAQHGAQMPDGERHLGSDGTVTALGGVSDA